MTDDFGLGPPQGRGDRALAYACFFLSGASALVYEVAWMRQLRLVTGATTAAVSTLLAVYMGGLAVGAFALGRLADRSRAPLKLYAYLEAAIGAYALLLPRLQAWATPLYVSLARSVSASPGILMLIRVVFGAAWLLAPTVLMGGTLPVLVRFVTRSQARLGRDLGTLYGMNLAGAVVGTVASGFALIRWFGVQGATLVAAIVNLAIGALALVWSLFGAQEAGATSRPALVEPTPIEPLPARLRSWLFAIVFLSGFVSMGYEVLWTRILLFAFTSTIQAFAVILATFLTGLALGSGLFALLEHRWNLVRALVFAQLLAGLLALMLVPASLRAADILKAYSERSGGADAAIVAAMALSAAIVMLPSATLMGLVLPMASRLLTNDLRQASRRIGGAYMVNTVGAVLGSLLTGFGLIPLLTLKGSVMLLAAMQVAAGWALLPWSGLAAGGKRRLLAASALGLVACYALCTTLLRGPNPFDLVSPKDVEAHRDGVSASVSVVRNEFGSKTLRIDGFEVAATSPQSAYMAMMTHIPMLLHPDPKRLLVICFGTGTTAGTGLLYPAARVDAVDINPSVFAFADHFREANRGVAHDPRARLVVDDGRNYLLTTRETYDVITAEPMPPTFAGVTHLYSREYYALARERLAPGGIVVQWLPFHLVKSSEALAILRTMQDVFPETTLWMHSSTGIAVARRDRPVEIDLAALRRRLADEGLARDLDRLGVRGVGGFLELFMLGPSGVRQAAAGARLITDDLPFLEFHPSPYRGVSWTLGSTIVDRVKAREIVYRMRGQDPLPLRANDDEAARYGEIRQLSTHVLLGALFVRAQLWEKARTEFEAGLARTQVARDRASFLYDLADVARREGKGEDARRLVDESLILWPDNVPAVLLREQLQQNSPPPRSGRGEPKQGRP
jgi:spermidine synthase